MVNGPKYKATWGGNMATNTSSQTTVAVSEMWKWTSGEDQREYRGSTKF